MPALSPVTLTTPDGSLSLSVIRKGLHFHRLLLAEVDGAKGGKTHDILPGLPDEFTGEREFQHCIVGRYVNRLPAKEIKLESGLTVTPQTFPPSTPGVSLHGGPEAVGWDQKVWDVVKLSAATLFSAKEKAAIEAALPQPQSAVFSLTAPDGEGGYPGEVLCEVLVGLVQGNPGSVVIIYRAALGKDGIETPINLTQHWGFNLEASLVGPGPTPHSTSVKNHCLTLKSSNILTLDPKTSLPTGSLTSSKGTAHEHNGSKIGEKYPSKGFDDFYLFDNANKPSIPVTFPEADLTTEEDRVSNVIASSAPSDSVAKLSSDLSGISLEFTTNQLGVQFYSAPGGGGKSRKRIHGGDPSVEGYGPDHSAYLEFHAPYGAFFLPELQEAVGGWNTILKKGDVYNNFVRMDISFGKA